ncbi:MAG TPA: ATP-binding protein [Pirellulales bacterium]|nr:ATP-binding protein [Pirellulales bacterium]
MSLAIRISAFFLAALALLLVGFSVVIYSAASVRMQRRLDERLNAALDALEASIDVERGGLEWEPQDLRILLGTESDVNGVRWLVITPGGALIDRSVNSPSATFPDDWRPDKWPTDPPDGTEFGGAGDWRMAGRRLLPEQLLRLRREHPEDDGPPDEVVYPELLLMAGLSGAPIEADLRQLAAMLIGTSLALWSLCAGLGYWLSRRALAPVVRMATAVRQMSVAEQAGSIALPNTGDELDDLALAFNGLLSRLHGALERQRRFAGDASHQLRTPLAGLLSLVDVLRRRARTVEEYAGALDQIRQEAVRMRQIVESLMFLAHAEADALPLARETLDLSCWLPEQLKRWESHSRGGDIACEVEEAPLTIAAHPSLLAQLLDNLIDNACKYSEPACPVKVRGGRDGRQVRIAVEDQGSGIAEADLPHLFEPFYRAAQARQQNKRGVGLGLAVVQRIAETLGASIRVEHRKPRGTRFVVTFPEAPTRASAPRDSEAVQVPAS